MKVVFFEPRSESYFGAQRSMTVAAVGLQKRGHKVCVLTTSEGILAHGVRRDGVSCDVLGLNSIANTFGGKVIRYNFLKKAWLGVALISYSLRAIIWLVRDRPDVICFNNERALLLLGLPAKVLNIPTVFYVRLCLRPSILPKLSASLPDRIILIAQGVASYFTEQEHARFGKKMSVLNTGFEVPSYRSLNDRLVDRKRLGIPSEIPVLCVVGSISPRKNQKMIIRNLGPLMARGDFRLLLVGDPAHQEAGYADELQALAADYGVGKKIICTGYVDDPSIYFGLSDVCVLAAKAEGLPRVLLEALSMGCAVVTTDAGGAAEAVPRSDLGRVVSTEDEISFGKALYEVVHNFPRDDQARLLRRQFVVDNFPVEKYIDGLEKVFQELVDQ